jgi:glyoxylate reductase
MGKIGEAVARLAAGFGMQVIFHNRSPRPDAVARGARPVTLEELLRGSDVLAVTAPATPETHHLIDAAALARMKPGAVLVNTSRGSLVVEDDLVDALRTGQLRAAGLDVYEREPAMAPALATLENVVLLPHLGSATDEARAAMVELACANVASVLSGQPPLTPVRVPT